MDNNKEVKIIGLTGNMGSGKSTAAAILKKIAGPAHIIKFAQPLYDMQEYIYARAGLEPVKDRRLLQWLGTEWGRSINKNLWIDIWKEDVTECLERNKDAIVICDDVRFDEEAQIIKDMGGKIIKMISNVERIDKVNTGHASEKGINRDLVNAVVINDGTLEDLEKNLKILLGLL